MFQPAKESKANLPDTNIDGKAPTNVDSFTYLGSSLSSFNSLDKEVQPHRQGKCFLR